VYQSYVTYTEVRMCMTSYSRILIGPFHIHVWKTRRPIETEAPIKSVEVNIEIKTIRIHNVCKLSVFWLVAMLDGTLRHWPATPSVFYCAGFSVRGSQSEHVISTLVLRFIVPFMVAVLPNARGRGFGSRSRLQSISNVIKIDPLIPKKT
jgi:hypothetical protein